MEVISFLIAFLSGLSFFIGYLIIKIIKDEKKLNIFSVGFAFSVIIGLCFFDLLGECLEMENKIIMLICMISGILLLKILDFFIPEHEHSDKNEIHMQHIGIISTIALFLHNIIEGTAIYTTSLTNATAGLFMALGVSFHNIPLGIQISSLMHNKKERIKMLSLLSISSIVGALCIILFNIEIGSFISGILLSISFGMLIYISLFELLCEVKEHLKNKYLIIGLITGILFILLGHLLH